jgi:hypothetical protein
MTPKAKKKSDKHWWDLTPQERDEDVKQFDKPLPPGRTKPLTKKQRLLWKRAQSEPSVSIYVHDDRADILIHLDDELLARARDFAKKKKTSLPKMIRGMFASQSAAQISIANYRDN